MTLPAHRRPRSAQSFLASAWFALCLNLVAVGLSVSQARAEEPADALRPAAIETQGVPAVPPALAERLRQYQSTRSAAFAGWAPDGAGMLIETRFGNSAQLHRVHAPGGRREQLTFFEEPVGGRFIPEANDGSLLVTMSRGGNENNQIYLSGSKRLPHHAVDRRQVS